MARKFTACGCLAVLGFIVLIIVVAVSQWGAERPPTESTPPVAGPSATAPVPPRDRPKPAKPSPAAPPSATVALPSYEIIENEKYDAPIKAQVVMRALVSGKITEEGLKALLRRLYDSAMARRDFTYYDCPTNVFIYLYTSKENAEGGSAHIAMLCKVKGEKKPSIYIKEAQMKLLGKKPEVKFGLQESTRRAIFKEIIGAEDRASRQAEARFPLEPASYLKVGQTVRLSKETPLMPELEPADPMAAISKIRYLPQGTRIEVTQVATKKSTPWYAVKVFNRSGSAVDTGWVNSVALMGQVKVDGKAQLRKQAKYERELNERYLKQIAEKHGLTIGQLQEIGDEGMTKDWPFPTPTEAGQPPAEIPDTASKEAEEAQESKRGDKGHTVVAAESMRGITTISVVLKGEYTKSEIMEISRKLKRTYAPDRAVEIGFYESMEAVDKNKPTGWYKRKGQEENLNWGGKR